MGIPLPALSIRPPESPISQVGQAVALQSMLGRQQLQQQQIQQQQMQIQSSKAITQAFIKHNGSVDDQMIQDAAQGGALPEHLQALQQHQLQMKNLLLTGEEGKLRLQASQNAIIGQHAQAAMNSKDPKSAALQSVSDLVKQGIFKPEDAASETERIQDMNDQDLKDYLQVHALGAMNTKDQIETALDARKTAAQEKEADIKAKSFAAEQPGGTKENPEQKYIRLQAAQKTGQSLTENDAAWMKGYEKNKTMVPGFNFNLQAGGIPPSPGAAAGKTGQDFLNGLPTQRQGIVKGIAEGRIPMPSSFALKTPYWQSVMNDVLAYDPEFSTQRADLRKGFTTGKQSTEINAINTALGHVGALGDAVDALKNGNIQVLNNIANKYGVQVGQTPATTLQTIVNRVGPELVKAYSGTAGSEAERQQFEKDFSQKMSPDQLKSNVSTTVQLLHSKISSLENQWNQNKAPGTPDFQDRFIMPAAKQVIDKQSTPKTGGMIRARDSQGKLHEAPAGTALPAGWKEEK